VVRSAVGGFSALLASFSHVVVVALLAQFFEVFVGEHFGLRW
jgi:hypothetical protein